MIEYYLLVVHSGIEPVLQGPFSSELWRDIEARRRRRTTGDESGIFRMDVRDGKPDIYTYSGGFMQKGTIYTIGYQALTLKQIMEIMDEKGAEFLVDVRSVPYSRRPDKYEFNKNRLQEKLGSMYRWMGVICGGKTGPAKESCIDELRRLSQDNAILLMCMENNPCKCHRFYDLARRLEGDDLHVVHIFDGKEMTTAELEEVCDG